MQKLEVAPHLDYKERRYFVTRPSEPQFMHIRQERIIAFGRQPHPNPDIRRHFDQGIGAHRELFNDGRLRGDVGTSTRLAEFESVIRTADAIPLNCTHRQRHPSMRTAVCKCHSRSIFGAEKNDMILEDLPRHHFATDFAR